MSEEMLRNLEREMNAMRKVSEAHHQDMVSVMSKIEVTMEKVAEAIDEISKLRDRSHDYGNQLARLPLIEQRVSKLEAHDDAREAELKESFAKRDEKMSKASEDCHTRINNLSRIVYIGMGIAMALQAFGILKKVL